MKVLRVILAAFVLALAAGCATQCKSGDEVCAEKQQAEYGRPFWEPDQFRR